MYLTEKIGNYISNIKKEMKNFYSSRNRFNRVLDTSIIVTFTLLIFSIPSASFITGLHYITWALTILLIILMSINVFINRKLILDLFTVSYVSFLFFAFLSCALTKFVTISATYFLLTAFMLFIYQYCLLNKQMKSILLSATYFACILFLAYYSVFYGKQMFSFGLNRLGEAFGDINDIAIFNGIGFSFALYYVFFGKKIISKIVNGLILLLFLLAIISSGSKIAYLFIPILFLACVFLKNGKKRIWISILVVIVGIAGIILIMLLPAFSIIKNRIVSMINTFVPIGSSTTISSDYSTIHRSEMIAIGFDMFFRRPLLGYGVNGFQFFGGYSNGRGWSHNHFAEILSSTGMLGFVFYNFPIFYSVYSSYKNKRGVVCILLSLYCVSMISIALPGEKLFAYLFGLFACCSFDSKPLLSFYFFKKRKGQVETNDSDLIQYTEISI